jgi:hypothetical protein
MPDILAVFADSMLAAHGLIDIDVLRRTLLAPHIDWTVMFAMEDHAAVKLLWLAVINIEDKRAHERTARHQQAGKRSDQPARLVEVSASWAGARS